MHAASVNPEPGSNSPKICAACAATSSEGLTTRTSITDFLSLFSCQGAASGAGHTAAQTHDDGALPPWCQTSASLRSLPDPASRPPSEGGTAANGRGRTGAVSNGHPADAETAG